MSDYSLFRRANCSIPQPVSIRTRVSTKQDFIFKWGDLDVAKMITFVDFMSHHTSHDLDTPCTLYTSLANA